MIFVLLILTLLVIFAGAVSTIPFSIGLLTIITVLFKKSWVFFLGLGLGLFLDLIMVRALGYTSLVFTIFVFILFLYERKFETRTTAFVFISSFLGSLAYLKIFDYQQIFLQALINAIVTVVFFRVMLNLFQHLNQKWDPESSSG